MFSYTVWCEFTDPQIARRWIQWLKQSHIQDVLDAGAQSAEIFKVDAENETYEIRYRFASRKAFEDYQLNHAPRLRAEGLAKFPLDLGLKFSRSTAELISRVGLP